jgi:hypothetical protein
MSRAAQVRAARKRYLEMAPVLDEQTQRRFVALEAHSPPPVRGPYRILSLPRQPHGQRRQCVQGSVRLNENLSA